MNTKTSEIREQVKYWFVRDFTPEETADRTGLPLRTVERHYDALLDATGGGKTPDYHLEKSSTPATSKSSPGPSHMWTGTQRRASNSDQLALPASAPRQFGGAQPAHHQGPPKGKRADPNDTSKCGSLAGYRYHKNHGSPVCSECRDAYNEYQRSRTHGNRPDCGTYNGWASHTRRKEKPCAPCQKAKNEYGAVLRARAKAKAAQAAADDLEEQS